MKGSVCIIGAGIGGLCLAALLAKSGVGVTVFEKASKVGGRTVSMIYRNHILDNGFHIMPFYKKSAIYQILKRISIDQRLELTKVKDIAFYNDSGFHKYPRNINDLLKLSIIPFSSRMRLLCKLLPLAFSTLEKTEKLDEIQLTQITRNLDIRTKAFLMLYACWPSQIFRNIYHLENSLEQSYVLIRLREGLANLDILETEDMT